MTTEYESTPREIKTREEMDAAYAAGARVEIKGRLVSWSPRSALGDRPDFANFSYRAFYPKPERGLTNEATKEQPMKIERDKWWVTRNGEKQRIICTDAPGEYPVVAIAENGSIWRFTTGGIHILDQPTSPYNLVSEYTPPLECWVNVRKDEYRTYYSTEEFARKEAGEDRAVRIAVHMREVEK